MHPAHALWNAHHDVAPYPDGCVAVRSAIPFTAFFPGGYGLWNPEQLDPPPTWPIGKVMVLGHDFHSKDGYEKSLSLGWESDEQPTWRSLKQMLSVAGIPLSSCFFTNFYMGLRQGAATTGRFPGAGDARFVHRCGEFLTKQLDHQRPALVLTLGAWVPRLLAAIEGGPVAWNGVTTLKEIDGRCRALLRDVRLHAGAPCVVAALSHPSFYPRSASARAFGGTTGRGAHELLMHSAARAASIG
jgi:hypothetical protein